MTDDRIAKIINVTMFTILGAAVFGFAAWGAVTGFSHVRAIYRSLSSNEQNQLTLFFNSLGLLILTSSMAFKAARGWFARRAAKRAP